MRVLIGTVTTIACVAMIMIAAQGSLLGGPAAAQTGISIYDLHRTYPQIANLPTQEPPLP